MKAQTKNLRYAAALAESAAYTEKKWRQKFHLMPVTGWMNDPNGLCQKDGVYHVYFQYSPFDVKPGLNFWGHYTTENFVDYNYHEPALCCDEQIDCHGVYSGSAFVEDGEINLFYTGNVKHIGNYDYTTAGREHNTILVTSADGFEMSEKKLLMTNADYPENVTCHVRDPKVWKENGSCYMVLGARRIDDVGEILVYKSNDKINWTLANRITTPEKLGYMWECPDCIEINGKRFLMFSPQGMEAEGYRFNNVYQSGYVQMMGDLEGEYTLSEFDELDRGFDFYAPQSFEDEKGRRILIAWMGLPDVEKYYQNPTDTFGWMHTLTMPRVLTEINGKIYQNPIEEYKKLRGDKINPEQADIFEAEITDIKSDRFNVTVKNDCLIEYKDKVISLKFGKSGCGRDVRSAVVDELKNMRIFCDSSSIEVFVNSGEAVFTSRFYPENGEKGIKIDLEQCNSSIWEINGFTIKK